MLRWAIMFDWRRPGHECIAAIAQLGERQTEDVKVFDPGSRHHILILCIQTKECYRAARCVSIGDQ